VVYSCLGDTIGENKRSEPCGFPVAQHRAEEAAGNRIGQVGCPSFVDARGELPNAILKHRHGNQSLNPTGMGIWVENFFSTIWQRKRKQNTMQIQDSIKGTNTMRIQCTNEGNTQEPAEIGNGSSCPVDIGATNSNATDASGEDSDDPTYQARARKVSKKSKARKRPEEVKHGSVCFLLWNFVRRTNEKWKQYMKKDVSKNSMRV
jgi:hypothetical protein